MFEIINEIKEHEEEIPELKKVVRDFVKKERLENALFNIILVDNEAIRKLNREYRSIDKETDVISFALEDEKEVNAVIRVLGDVYISLPKAEEQAQEYGHSFFRELSFLTVHGLLHLLGYDHMTSDEEKEMFQKQEQFLQEENINR